MKRRRTKVCARSVGRLLVQSDDPDHVLEACRIAGKASRYSLLQSIGEYLSLPCVPRRRERLRQRRHEDRAEKPCALARESCGIPVPLKLDPSWVGHPQGVGMLNGEPMKPSVGGKRRQQILLTPRARGDRHAPALFGSNRAGSDQLKEFGVRVVHHRSEPYGSIVIERGQRDNQTAARPQLGCP